MRKILSICLALLLTVCLAATVEAAGNYVIDDAALLTQQERSELNAYAANIAKNREIGIYILTVYDYRDYGEEYEIFDVLWNYYHDNGLGYGQNREGMILMLSMRERDYATFYYGERTEYAFNSYGQEQHETYFLDNFGYDDWYGGFMDYLTVAEDYLLQAALGEPVRESPWPMALLFVCIALAIAGIATAVEWSKMKNVARKTDAIEYQTDSGLALTVRTDQFIRQTVTRRKIQTQSTSGGSGARVGGGGSGRSGKF